MRRLNPQQLLLSKWTAVAPRKKENHFIVTKVIEPEPPAMQIEFVELEVVYNLRSFTLHRRELTDASRWLQGWQ